MSIADLLSKYAAGIPLAKEKKVPLNLPSSSSSSTLNSSPNSSDPSIQIKINSFLDKFSIQNFDLSGRCVGLLFIVIDSLPNEALWRLWLNEAEEKGQAKVLIHAKNPKDVTSQWVKDRLCSFQLNPKWGSVELTRVMMGLVHEALRIQEIGACVFVSESCLPIASFEETYSTIFSSPTSEAESWLNWYSEPNNGYSLQQQFQPLRQIFPQNQVCKADQWLLLSRRHATYVDEFLSSLLSSPTTNGGDFVKNNVAFDWFRKVRASDEMFFPTLLAALLQLSTNSTDDIVKPTVDASSTSEEQISKESVEVSKLEATRDVDILTPSNIQCRRVTYANWDGQATGPLAYYMIGSSATQAMIRQAKLEGCLFVRKLKLSVVTFGKPLPGGQDDSQFVDSKEYHQALRRGDVNREKELDVWSEIVWGNRNTVKEQSVFPSLACKWEETSNPQEKLEVRERSRSRDRRYDNYDRQRRYDSRDRQRRYDSRSRHRRSDSHNNRRR